MISAIRTAVHKVPITIESESESTVCAQAAVITEKVGVAHVAATCSLRVGMEGTYYLSFLKKLLRTGSVEVAEVR